MGRRDKDEDDDGRPDLSEEKASWRSILAGVREQLEAKVPDMANMDAYQLKFFAETLRIVMDAEDDAATFGDEAKPDWSR